MSRRCRAVAVIALLVVGATTALEPLAGAATGDWTTYHHDGRRTADASLTGTFSSLTPTWSWKVPQGLAAQDLYGEPLIADGLVIVTSSSNWVYALHASDGSLAWERKLGHPEVTTGTGVCGDVQTAAQPTIGITSTPVIDESRSEIFAVAAIGTGAGFHTPVRTLFGLDLSTGAVELARDVDPKGIPNPYLLQRAALAETGGQIIVGFGGNDGDCGSYHGWLESVSASSPTAPIFAYRVSPGTGSGPRGAIWMGGGAPTVAGGRIVVADGNGVCDGSAYDYSDSVLSLSPTMQLLDWFTPSSFNYDNCNDLDLGSGAPQLLESGLILQIGKTHLGYLLNATDLGHQGATPPTFSVCTAGQDNGGGAIVSQTPSTAIVAIPCAGGLEEVTVTGGSTPSGSIDWSTDVTTGPPILAAGSLFAIEVSSTSSTLVAVDTTTGAIEHRASIGPAINHFETPSAGDGILVAAGSKRVFAFTPSTG